MSSDISIEAFIQHLEELKKLTEFERFRKFLRLFLIGFFIGRENKKRIKVLALELNNILQQKSCDLEKHVSNSLGMSTYLISSEKKGLLDSIGVLINGLKQFSNSKVPNVEYIKEIEEKLTTLKESVLDYNSSFIRQRKRDYRYLWSNGEFTLDEEQITSIVTDDKHNLVVAAAGSGKTEWYQITRIAYIVKRQPDFSPQERILAIAYQNKASGEIGRRLKDRYEITNVNVSTFHKLGKGILEEARSKYRHSDIIDNNKKRRTIDNLFRQKIETNQKYYNLFLSYVKTLHDKEKKETGEANGISLEYAIKQAYVSIDRTQVNSRAEKEIIDFFLIHKLNGKKIIVEYEPDVGGFRPDFYLPQYDLYIEHWALNKNGEVPEWFNQSSDEYKKSMDMKRTWFKAHNKLFVETFTHEYKKNKSDNFIELLKKRVIDALETRSNQDFEFSLKSYDEIVEIAWNSYLYSSR